MSDAIHYRSVALLGDAYRARTLSPAEVVAHTLERIDRLDRTLASHITVMRESAVADAKRSEERFARGAPLGPLDGIPIGLKDLYDTAGTRTTAASRVFRDRVPDRDATVVARLRNAGAVLVGKHVLNEFASARQRVGDEIAPPSNPWDVTMASGGSSSGSAVAVAAGLCAGAFGSDTGGSIRLPASNCGVVGLKPTNGLVSTAGVIPLSWTLDVAGPLARSVEDAALLLQAVAGHDDADPRSADVEIPEYRSGLARDARTLRVGAPLALVEAYPDIDDEALAAYHAALEVLRRSGLAVRVVRLSDEIAHAKSVFSLVMLPEALAYHREILRTRPDGYGPRFRARLLEGVPITATEYALGLRGRARIRGLLDEVMRSVDVLALPTVPWPHAARDDNAPVPADRAFLTFLFNLSGQPAISVPCGFTKAGLPLGLQLAARRFEEPTLFAAARTYEQAAGWWTRRPPLEAVA